MDLCNEKCNWKCLFNSLKNHMYSRMPWTYPSKMREYINLDGNMPLCAETITKLENKLKGVKINIQDYYNSPTKSNYVISLKVVNGHIKVDNKQFKVRGIAFKDKKPMIYNSQENINRVHDHKGERVLTREEFLEIKRNPITTEYLLIPFDVSKKAPPTMKEQYDEFIKKADLLLEASKGEINLYRTGLNITTALNLFTQYQKMVIPEEITDEEARYIEDASKSSSLIWSEKGYSGIIHESDICSDYPSIMAGQNMKFVIKRGTFTTLTQEYVDSRMSLSYGIYKCQIQPTEETTKYIDKVFKFNPTNTYTHIVINHAKKLKMKIIMENSGKPNALQWFEDDLVSGSKLFGEYVNVLFALKKAGYPAKEILNILWGALSQAQKQGKAITIDVRKKDNANIPEGATETGRIQLSDFERKIYYREKGQSVYKTNFARIKPFILTKGLVKIADIALPHIKHVVKIKTDAVYSNIKLNIDPKIIKYGDELGQLRHKEFKAKILDSGVVKKL